MLRRIWLASALLLCGTPGLMAQATNNSSGAAAPRLVVPAERQDPVDAKIQDALRERDAIIRNLLARVQELENRLNATEAHSPIAVGSSHLNSLLSPEQPVSAPSSAVTAVVNNAAYDEEERRASQALDRALLVRGGLLLPNGVMETDNTASYFSMSSDHLTVDGFALFPILVVGDITSERLRRDIIVHSLTTRLGLPGRFQMDFVVPYGYVLNRAADANGHESTQSQFGLGDIQAGLSRQFALERGRLPDILGSFRYKSDTGTNSYDLQSAETSLGTGFNSFQASITAAKTSDPVVFFGNVSYTRSLPAHHTIPSSDPSNPDISSYVGYLRPGDAFGFQLGSVLALNSETSMTLGWDQRFTQETKLNGVRLPASYLVEGSLRIGTSYMYAPNRMVDVSFGVGLTPDTPNLQFSVGFPIRKSLWKARRPH